MIINEEERKRKAIQLMQQLGMRAEFIEDFKNNVRHCSCYLSDFAAINNITFAKMEELEKEKEITIYAVLFNSFSFGDCFTYLIVPKYKEDCNRLIISTAKKDNFQVYAYVWNATYENRSEYGYVQVKVVDGILKRIC